MAESKAAAIDLGEFVVAVEGGEWVPTVGEYGPSVVVYSKSQGWREEANGDPGWPFMADGAGEQRVIRAWWDDDTNTIVTIIE